MADRNNFDYKHQLLLLYFQVSFISHMSGNQKKKNEYRDKNKSRIIVTSIITWLLFHDILIDDLYLILSYLQLQYNDKETAGPCITIYFQDSKTPVTLPVEKVGNSSFF